MKVALVTGGGNGLGEAICGRFAADGYFVYIADIDGEAASRVAGRIGGNNAAVTLDVRSDEQWGTIMAQIAQRFQALDVLVNNAGVIPTGSVETLDLQTFRDALDVNLIGAFLGCKHAIPLMKTNGGAIVNMSSRAALRASASLIGYGASKAGLTMLTKSVALHCAEQGYNIRCNSVHPGLFATAKNDEIADVIGERDEVYRQWQSRIPLGRIGQPSEVAAMVAFIASDEAAYATGGEFVLDGGSSL